ncbi:N-acetyltransferase family protein [Ekhidna sp.]
MRLNGDFSIEDASLSEVKSFLRVAGSSLSAFRYFEKRPYEVILNHLKTLVVMNNNQPVGYGHLDPEDGITWLGICVAERFRGKGIGKLIMNELIKSAKRMEVEEIQLSVDSDNNEAIQLYVRFGFRLSSVEENIRFMKLSL